MLIVQTCKKSCNDDLKYGSDRSESNFTGAHTQSYITTEEFDSKASDTSVPYQDTLKVPSKQLVFNTSIEQSSDRYSSDGSEAFYEK